MRKGLGKNKGKGYHNILPMDSHIHSLSAKGVKSKMSLPERQELNRAFEMVVDIMEKYRKEVKESGSLYYLWDKSDLKRQINFLDKDIKKADETIKYLGKLPNTKQKVDYVINARKFFFERRKNLVKELKTR